MQRIEARLRLFTGLVLAVYVVQHVVNHAFGIVSIEAAEAYRKTVGAMFQNLPGLVLFYGSLLFHALIALRSVYRRATLRMPAWEWTRILLGLAILPLVVDHAVGNRGYDILGDVEPNYFYVVTSLLLKPAAMYKLAVLLPVVWIHMAIGLHFWLRLRESYPRYLPYLYALVILIPVLSAVGVYRMLEQARGWLDDPAVLDRIYAANIAMDRADVELLRGLETRTWAVMIILLAATLIARQLRLWLQARRGVYRISRNGAEPLRALSGVSLLEALRNAGIPHAAVCGGRARCTTCRVHVGNGLDQLPAPDRLEAQALERIKASPGVRLACQLYPAADLAITPLVSPDQPIGKALHGGGVQGHEQYVVAMFVDMRGSTNLGERVLAYDVVFILNRFFTELSDALGESHGHYAQFAGDGLMALYGLDPARKQHACRDALEGAEKMFERIDALNRQLEREFGESVKMGIGIHGGDAIVGTMGPPKTPLLTAVGDNINIAARLEAQTKVQGCDMIVSVETLEREAIAFPDRRATEVDVRGRENRVRVCTFDRGDLPLDAAG